MQRTLNPRALVIGVTLMALFCTHASYAASVKPTKKSANVQTGMQVITDELATALAKQKFKGFLRIAVLPFETLDVEAKNHKLGRICSELLSSRLSHKPAILQVERSRLDSVIDELKMSERGELSPEGAASVGKLLGANSVVLGSVATAGPNYLVTARVVDSETGRVLTASDHDFARAGMVAFSEDVVEVRSRLGAAARSAAMPGWGQFYNGDYGRGVTYSALFLGTAAGAIASAVLGSRAENDYNDNKANTVDRRADANDHYDRANIFLLTLGIIWATAVTDAYVAGENAQTINLELAPEIYNGSTAASLTIGGRF